LPPGQEQCRDRDREGRRLRGAGRVCSAMVVGLYRRQIRPRLCRAADLSRAAHAGRWPRPRRDRPL